MDTSKLHYFLTYATVLDANTGMPMDVTIMQGYNSKVINKSGLKYIETQIEAFVKSKDSSITPQNIEIRSVSYLGEMTEAEFNS
ncbi:hypothetical protein ACKER8_14615 [Acinetobacter baumannii]|uniref:hypothetical protein n=1 Tax=Acinetobacter baumannii TaxID=470 RepID=UPI0038B500F7